MRGGLHHFQRWLQHSRAREDALQFGTHGDVSSGCNIAFLIILSPLKHRKFVSPLFGIATIFKSVQRACRTAPLRLPQSSFLLSRSRHRTFGLLGFFRHTQSIAKMPIFSKCIFAHVRRHSTPTPNCSHVIFAHFLRSQPLARLCTPFTSSHLMELAVFSSHWYVGPGNTTIHSDVFERIAARDRLARQNRQNHNSSWKRMYLFALLQCGPVVE